MIDVHDYPDAIHFPGLEHCIIGITTDERFVYSYDKLLDHFVNEFSDSEEPETDALEWIAYNVVGTNVEQGPLVMYEY